MGWEKFAIQGATYARALENAGQRAGRTFAPGAFAHIATQPRATLKPGLSAFVREPGTLQPTQQQQGMQQMLNKVPWATAEHGGSAHAEGTLNGLLQRRGLNTNTPAGQPNVNQRIQQEFGAPKPAPFDAEHGAPGPARRSNQPTRTGDIWSLQDKNVRAPRAIGLPGNTHPAYMPTASGDGTQVLTKAAQFMISARRQR